MRKTILLLILLALMIWVVPIKGCKYFGIGSRPTKENIQTQVMHMFQEKWDKQQNNDMTVTEVILIQKSEYQYTGKLVYVSGKDRITVGIEVICDNDSISAELNDIKSVEKI